MEVYLHFHDLELYEFGAAMSLAFNSPKDLQKLDPKYRRVTIDYDQLPDMLKIPKKTKT